MTQGDLQFWTSLMTRKQRVIRKANPKIGIGYGINI